MKPGMSTKRESMKQAEAESGQPKDIKGVPHENMSKSAHAAMRKPNHEFGSDRGGTDCHQTWRGKS